MQTTNVHTTRILLSRVQELVQHQQVVENLRGERFNVFSILGIERRENQTHSAFLAELLNPRGSHGKGRSFLELLLKRICAENALDVLTTSVFTEYSIGMRNDQDISGGRIDIFMRDAGGRCVTIENKIDAGDQLGQVQRYCKFNPGRNLVYYLTLHGTEPSEHSKGELEAGNHFHLLSYREDVLGWLEDCHKVSSDSPILRETLKQYILLIKKLTGMMNDDQHEQQMARLIFEHYAEAEYIAANFSRMRQQLQQEIRTALVRRLNAIIDSQDGLIAHEGSPIQSTYAQVWVYFESFSKSTLCFGIESFNGRGNYGGDLFIGLFNNGAKENSYTRKLNVKPEYWLDIAFLEWNGQRVNLGNVDLLKNLHFKPELRQEFVNHLADFFYSYILQRKDDLLEFTKVENVKHLAEGQTKQNKEDINLA